MPARLPRPAPRTAGIPPARRATRATLALLALAGCGDTAGEKFAPTCPVPTLPVDSRDIHRFRGSGRDITDSVLDGRILSVGGTCTRGDPGITVATIAVGLELSRGPANPGRTAQVAYFVAVTEGERILDKRIYVVNAEFPPNTDRLRLVGDQLELNLPVTPQKTAAAYRINVGFQLTPTELQVNRTRSAR